VKPSNILLAEAREVDSVDLYGIMEIRNAFTYSQLELMMLTSASNPNLFSEPGW